MSFKVKLIFNINTDKIDAELYKEKRKPTKREFLRVIMSIYDPLGFLTPFTILSRIIMQKIWNSKVEWDEELHEEQYLQ